MTKKQLAILREVESSHSIPANILEGVLELETTYRKWYHRFAENSATICLLLLNRLIGIPVRNFTIGYCQIGIASILSTDKRRIYRHCRYLNRFEANDIFQIIKAMGFESNLLICAELLEQIYLKEVMLTDDINIVYRRVGEEYNGTLGYGLMLEELCTSGIERK